MASRRAEDGTDGSSRLESRGERGRYWDITVFTVSITFIISNAGVVADIRLIITRRFLYRPR